ncbi:DNA mismatch repair protein Mlh1 [Episyrphus balteatus]|uniref:DNA mismatch repair protein Mlh1 n=1 Tax=Episyrphus balteatus TaxID=286459 RepID=UPI002485A7D6|nr:DNA mismatch repair protein Mlh1 [Episyrphus balteatus]
MECYNPGIIKKLEEAVVNRIAAGEIIQRPSNSVKELIENCLDAKSSLIQITVKNGGLKLLQILDNGTGIRKEDMEIVCKRFTTSKLVDFEDLSHIATFGFRGEALASISHVAHLTIQTKTKTEKNAYKASYVDGELAAPLTPCAGIQGTIITIEDLFYNMPQRKQALKSPNEEFQKIVDVVMKYAVQNSKVGFTLKKQGQSPFIRTMPNSTQKDNIKNLYGMQIFKELLDVELKDDLHRFAMKALITKVSYSAKKLTFLLFINNRLVDSSALKLAIDSAYSSFLPKGAHPFVYMSLELEPTNVDVNIHPTKHEVHFLNEEDIVEKIKGALEETLLSSKTTKKVYQQMKLPGAPSNEKLEVKNVTQNEAIRADSFVRTDSKDQKLEKFLINSQSLKMDVCLRDESDMNMKEVKLTSVLNMRKRIQDACSTDLKKTFRSMVFVGVVDKTFALYQYGFRMYLCNISKLCEELFYQRLVFKFQNFKEIRFEPGISLKDLMVIAFESIDWSKADGSKEDAARRATKLLMEKSALLKEYFSVKISEAGLLESLPSLLNNHEPNITFLPMYLLRLATKVNWNTEEDCFESFCRETALFYSSFSRADATSKKHKWMIEHSVSPALKKELLPSTQVTLNMYELTNLQILFKVFERC